MGLIKAFRNAGGVLIENSRVVNMDNTEPINVTAESGEYKCEHFIYATHIPPGVNLLHFRCAPYRSYAISCKLENESDYPDSLVYDLYDPYHYYRTQIIDGERFLIAGGEDHKTGHEENTENCFRKLESHVRGIFKVDRVTQKWSSQYYEPADGLPYIGHLPGVAGKVYVATGYGGNGITYSGVSALLLTDMISGGESEWADVYDPNRIKMIAGFSNFVKEAADVVGHLFKKAVIPTEKLSLLVEIAPGEAAIVKYDGHKIAIYKTEAGEVHALHTACTHIKCDVAWNATERTWDCPCHGSRFNFNGEVLTAPARKPLESVDITKS
jgi:Rieske Fe-S protein